jgi:hypothetical protein
MFDLAVQYGTMILIAIGAGLIVFVVIYQSAHNAMLNKAQFIQSTNDRMREYEDVRGFLKRPAFDLRAESHGVPVFVRIRDYGVLFESIYFLVKQGLISKREFSEYFGKRFTEYYNHKTIEACLMEPEMRDIRRSLVELKRLAHAA